MNRKRKTKGGGGATAVASHRFSHEDVIRRTLSKAPGIDAIFLLTDDADVLHVFTVVKEFHGRIYDTLLRNERAVEKKLAGRIIEFHTRAHQGRELAQAVPPEARLVYAR